MNRGVPPTARNARTGEFTPPGVTIRARSNRACEVSMELTRRFSQPNRPARDAGTEAFDTPNIGCTSVLTLSGDGNTG
jgi:hypothetical protein